MVVLPTPPFWFVTAMVRGSGRRKSWGSGVLDRGRGRGAPGGVRSAAGLPAASGAATCRTRRSPSAPRLSAAGSAPRFGGVLGTLDFWLRLRGSQPLEDGAPAGNEIRRGIAHCTRIFAATLRRGQALVPRETWHDSIADVPRETSPTRAAGRHARPAGDTAGADRRWHSTTTRCVVRTRLATPPRGRAGSSPSRRPAGRDRAPAAR